MDKTQLIERMVSEGSYYFLSRPRRFGKSLLLSTLKAYFQGKRELFKGLFIDRDDVEWKERPVLYFDLNSKKFSDSQSLYNLLDNQLSVYEQMYGRRNAISDVEVRLSNLVEEACQKTGCRVVILVDEYDKPLLQTIGQPELQEEFRSTLKAFYGVLKSQDSHIKFAMLTGVTRFSKISVFSDLNNLADISMVSAYNAICGLTEDDLHKSLDNEIKMLAESNGMDAEACYSELKRMYDGYHFCKDVSVPGIYNPFSVLSALRNGSFDSYWFETGTPEFLLKSIRSSRCNMNDITTRSVGSDLLGQIDVMDSTPLPLLFQSGYLTIKEYNPRFQTYRLGFPNAEVEEGFHRFLANYYTRQDGANPFFVEEFVADVNNGRAEQFMQRLNTFLSDGDYQIAGNAELYFQNVMYVVFKMLGIYVQAERHTSQGRIDIVLSTQDYVYVIELKLDGSASEALNQIEQNGYAAPFRMDGRMVFRIGANFSSETRCLSEWKVLEDNKE